MSLYDFVMKISFCCLYIFEIPSQCYAMMGCQNLNMMLCWLEGHYIGWELFEPPSLKIHWREPTDKQHRFVSAINWDTLLKIGLARPRHGCAPTDFLSEIWVLSWVRNAHHSSLIFALCRPCQHPSRTLGAQAVWPTQRCDDGIVHKRNPKTSQELRMLSSVTINCQVTKIVMNSDSQLSEL